MTLTQAERMRFLEEDELKAVLAFDKSSDEELIAARDELARRVQKRKKGTGARRSRRPNSHGRRGKKRVYK